MEWNPRAHEEETQRERKQNKQTHIDCFSFHLEFEFMALLQSLVASIALLGVAKLLVEQLMIRALKERHVYKSYKYEVTEDFSDRYTPQKSSPSSSIPLPPDLSKSFSPPTTIQDTSKPTEGSNGGVISTSFKEDV
ncbi:hypothetical protein HMI54_012313 [Coelomomyces lativittatus]|nr:hypothetical protein HMI54_012313 [Coelomomyces lativittatus]